jgi:hypothetical protein
LTEVYVESKYVKTLTFTVYIFDIDRSICGR